MKGPDPRCSLSQPLSSCGGYTGGDKSELRIPRSIPDSGGVRTGEKGEGRTYRKERHETVPFEVLSLGVCEFSPCFLECPHFIPSDGFRPPS